MKKIININFHSRVIPIEESAYEILQQYIESLRRYFANEEGRDEIISDIENRFAELFSETLKKGAACITDADVNSIITSMGRPEEFEAAEESYTGTGAAGSTQSADAGASTQPNWQYAADEPRRLYRADNDKILGGVCAGLANYLKLDPAIVRIIFVLITFGWGAGFLLYLILWIVLPNKALAPNVRKRLYRNSDDRVIGGVASGLAAYFHIEVWIPRLIFALPLILGIVTSVFNTFSWMDWDGPRFITGGFGGTLFITYIVLWIILPQAVTASEKLEMRGEKVDLESIKNTIKSDLETFRGRAKDMGSDIHERVQQVGQQVKQNTQSFATEAGPAIRRTSNGFGHAVGVMFKAFFLFIAGLITFALVTVLAALLFRGSGIIHLKGLVLEGFWQNFLAWTGFFLFLVIPVVALLTWLIRRITGIRSKSHYLGYAFATLWIIGLFCVIILGGMVMSNFRSRQHIEEGVSLVQPSHNKLIVSTTEAINRYRDTDWWSDIDFGKHGPFYSLNEDSFLLTTIRVRVLKSEDSVYHVNLVKISRGSSAPIARQTAGRIEFPVRQNDSVLNLPQGFAISEKEKFRNQQVLVEVSVPVGKRIQISRNIEDYHWFTINPNNRHIRWNGRRDWKSEWDEDIDDEDSYPWTGNVEYVMTPTGLSRTDHKSMSKDDRRHRNDQDDRDDDDNKNNDEDLYKEKEKKPGKSNDGYRYKNPESTPPKTVVPDSPNVKKTAIVTKEEEGLVQPYVLLALFVS